jgi:Domain of unknown function (DUF4136)
VTTQYRAFKAWPLLGVALLALLAGCQTRPEIRTQSAPNLDVAPYRTYGFVEKVGTDTAGYTTLTTRYLKESVNSEMQARGYTFTDKNPDLLINFNVVTQDKVEGRPGPRMGLGYGYWRRGYAWGFGVGDEIYSFTEGTLTIDVVDRERNELIWNGTAVGRLTKDVLENPQPAINQAVDLIFAKYPKQDLARTAQAK